MERTGLALHFRCSVFVCYMRILRSCRVPEVWVPRYKVELRRNIALLLQRLSRHRLTWCLAPGKATSFDGIGLDSWISIVNVCKKTAAWLRTNSNLCVLLFGMYLLLQVPVISGMRFVSAVYVAAWKHTIHTTFRFERRCIAEPEPPFLRHHAPGLFLALESDHATTSCEFPS